MREASKILISEYMKEFKIYYNLIKTGDWSKDVVVDNRSGLLDSSILNLESGVISTVVKSCKTFKDDLQDDMSYKKAIDVVNLGASILKLYVDKIDLYKKNNPINDTSTNGEVAFHSQLFSKKTSARVNYANISQGLNSDTSVSAKLFYRNVKAPLLMRTFLSETMPLVKNKVESLNIDFSKYESRIPLDSNEMYINMKDSDIPFWDNKRHFFEQSKEAIEFWEMEIHKCKVGINIGGYFIHPWLYWHLNFFKINLGAGSDKANSNVNFRDNEYFFAELLKKAEKHGRAGILMYGTRRFAKTVLQASYLMHGLFTIRNAQADVYGFSYNPDLKAVSDYIQSAVISLPPAFSVNLNTWDDKGMHFGIKTSAQDRFKYSDLTFNNLDNGSKSGSQSPAGLQPDRFLFDEIGKGPCIKVLDAARPSFVDSNTGKWRVIPICSGCVCADTLVYKSNGVLVKIQDLNKKDGIIGFDVKNNSVSVENITWIQPPSSKECYRINTNKGNHIECSYEHPILISRDGIRDFIEAKDVVAGDIVYTPNKIDIWGSDEKSYEEAFDLINNGSYNSEDILLDIHSLSKINTYKLLNKVLNSKLVNSFFDDGRIVFYFNSRVLSSNICKLLNKLGIHPFLCEVNSSMYTLTVYDPNCLLNLHSFFKFVEDDYNIMFNSLYFACREYAGGDNKDYVISVVTSNVSIGVKPIYNLTAGVTHTYLANGIVTHNTAGDSALSSDAESILKNPEVHDFLPMDFNMVESKMDSKYITWKHQPFGHFVPAQMSAAAPSKIKKKFSEFLRVSSPELDKLHIYVTDWEKANEFFHEERDKKSVDLSSLSRYKNSFPLEIDDCYLTTEVNKYPVELLQRHLSKIEASGDIGQSINLYKNGPSYEVSQSNAPRITEYPFRGGNFNAPIVILDNPRANGSEPPLGLYVIGFDDVKQDKTSGDSVMSATVFKRSYDGGIWADRIVAFYDSRPQRKRDFYYNLYLLLKFYNAMVLHENEDNGFVEYMEDKHEKDLQIHVSDGVGLASEDNLNKNKNRKFGWSPTPNNIYNLEQTIVSYSYEKDVVIGEEEGLRGADKINHPMLINEMLRAKKGLNADRIRSFGLALKLARYYDKTYQYLGKHRKSLSSDTKVKKKSANYRGLVDTSKLNRF